MISTTPRPWWAVFEVQASGAEDVSIIGDVDGDGLADLGVSAGSGVFIVYGRREAGRIDPAAGGEATELVGVGGWEGRQLEPAGDIDGDGLADVVGPSDGDGQLAWLLRGGPRVQRLDVRRAARASRLRAGGPSGRVGRRITG